MNNNIKLDVKLLKYQARESDSQAESQMAADFMQSQKIYILKVFRHFKKFFDQSQSRKDHLEFIKIIPDTQPYCNTSG